MPGDNRGPQDLVRTLSHVNFDEALGLAIQNRPVHVIHPHGKGVDSRAFFFGALLGDADMGNLRVRVGAPGNRERRAFLFSSREKGIVQHGSGHKIRCVGKLAG